MPPNRVGLNRRIHNHLLAGLRRHRPGLHRNPHRLGQQFKLLSVDPRAPARHRRAIQRSLRRMYLSVVRTFGADGGVN
jgi:hypothetical protein